MRVTDTVACKDIEQNIVYNRCMSDKFKVKTTWKKLLRNQKYSKCHICKLKSGRWLIDCKHYILNNPPDAMIQWWAMFQISVVPNWKQIFPLDHVRRVEECSDDPASHADCQKGDGGAWFWMFVFILETLLTGNKIVMV